MAQRIIRIIFNLRAIYSFSKFAVWLITIPLYVAAFIFIFVWYKTHNGRLGKYVEEKRAEEARIRKELEERERVLENENV